MSQGTSPPLGIGGEAGVFDWYAATIDDEPVEVVESIASWLGADHWEAKKGRNSYTAGAKIVRDGNTIATVHYGGQNPNPHAEASGEDAIAFAECVRAIWPDKHLVSRVDSAYDFKDGEPWQQLLDLGLYVANEPRQGPRMKISQAGDWHTEGAPDGRTQYFGSFKSSTLVRLYEKGKQMRLAFPDQADKFPIGWCRLELQLRPEKDARREAAYKTPHELWGAARWTNRLQALVLASPDLEPLRMRNTRQADDARAWSYLLRQYGPLLRRMVDAEAAEWERRGLHTSGDEERRALWESMGRKLGGALG